MITDAIIAAFFGGINALLSLLPTYSLPVSITNGPGLAIGQYATSIDEVIPLGTMVLITGLAFGLKGIFALLDLSVFIYHQFWGSN